MEGEEHKGGKDQERGRVGNEIMREREEDRVEEVNRRNKIM